MLRMSFQWKKTVQKQFKNCRKELSRYRALKDSKKKASLTFPASLTVEAACVLPIFLIAVSAALFLFHILIFQVQLQNAMDYAVQKASAYYYALEQIKGEEEEEIEEPGFTEMLVSGGLTAAYLQTQVILQMPDEAFQNACVWGGKAGLILAQSQFPDKQGAIDLIISYQINIPFLPNKIGRIAFTQRSRRLAWMGTPCWKDDRSEESERMVYITENGKVYHLTLNCSYLNLSIQSVLPNQIEKMRNTAGEIYRPCEKCAGEGKIQGYCLYITKTGNKYHYVLTCPGLTRNIRTVPFSEVNGIPECSRCGVNTE